MLDRHGVGNWGHVSWNIYCGHLVITTFPRIFVLHTFSAKRAKHLQQWLASVQSIYNYRVIFSTGPPCSVLKLNIANEPTGAAVPWNPSSERASDWPVCLFHFGIEQARASQKNHPVYCWPRHLFGKIREKQNSTQYVYGLIVLVLFERMN